MTLSAPASASPRQLPASVRGGGRLSRIPGDVTATDGGPLSAGPCLRTEYMYTT